MKTKISDYRKAPVPNKETAEALAVTILSWLVERPDLMSRFLALSGIEAGSIRQASTEPGFFGGLTGFLMAHEPTLISFCAENGQDANFVATCHQFFNGADEGTWL